MISIDVSFQRMNLLSKTGGHVSISDRGRMVMEFGTHCNPKDLFVHMSSAKRKESVEKVEKEKVIITSRFKKEKCKSAILSQSSKLSHVSYWLILILQKNEQEMPVKSMFLSNTNK